VFIKFRLTGRILAFLGLMMILYPVSSKAYTDLSTYKIETGKFANERLAQNGLLQLTKDTGLTGIYQKTNEYQEYYRIISGGFGDESRTKSILQQFKEETGINARYAGKGEPQNYYQIISGGFKGEDRAKSILKQFKEETGINGQTVGSGEPQNYYQIISGGFSGESRVKNILQQFIQETGINARYAGIGEQQDYYQIISGGFTGEARVKSILQQFVDATGIKANYVSRGNNSYRIESEPVLGLTEAKRGREFFISHSWSVTTPLTGEKGYKSYRIVSDPVLGDKVNQGRQFFIKNNWSVTTPLTGEKYYSSYRIVSDPVLGEDKVNRGRQFFIKNNWSVTSPLTGEKEYSSYQIISDPVLGLDRVNQGRQFFIKNNWSVTSPATGEKQYYYQIITQEINGFDKTQAHVQTISKLYGWTATPIKIKNGPQLMYTDYGLTLSSMLDKQMASSPQTDQYRNAPRYVYAAYVDMNKQIINADGVNLRTEPSMDGLVVQQLNKGANVIVIGKTGDWVEVRLTWQNANKADVNAYLNPNNFSIDTKDYFQFIKLSQPAYLNAAEVNQKILYGKGILANKGQSFIDAAQQYNVNEIYLISHSFLETGNGKSALANGVEYNGKIVYNMYGYGAYDSCPVTCGAQKAYENGWFTPEAAIIGGAKLISQEYIYNGTFQQDTLYKMRWNPVVTWHQYATDIAWAYKQVNSIYNLYQLIDNYTLYYDVPSYR